MLPMGILKQQRFFGLVRDSDRMEPHCRYLTSRETCLVSTAVQQGIHIRVKRKEMTLKSWSSMYCVSIKSWLSMYCVSILSCIANFNNLCQIIYLL